MFILDTTPYTKIYLTEWKVSYPYIEQSLYKLNVEINEILFNND